MCGDKIFFKTPSNYQAKMKDILSPCYMQTIKKHKSSNFIPGNVLQLFSLVLQHRWSNGQGEGGLLYLISKEYWAKGSEGDS